MEEAAGFHVIYERRVGSIEDDRRYSTEQVPRSST
jgi:hypothetical protein